MNWQDLFVAALVLVALAWVIRFSYCAATRNGSGCAACPKCQNPTEPRRLMGLSAPRKDSRSGSSP